MSTPGTGPSLASIHIYPLKGARGLDLRESLVQPWGLAGDRRWLLADPAGRFISQREEPQLARIQVRYAGPAPGEGVIFIAAPGRLAILVEPPRQAAGAEMVPVSVWRSELLAPRPARPPMNGCRTFSAARSG